MIILKKDDRQFTLTSKKTLHLIFKSFNTLLQCYNVYLKDMNGNAHVCEGFGSMLRSIGAQIEKTTNREACRDLSGRRMRDINNEKKFVTLQIRLH